MLGIQGPNPGGMEPETEKTLEICWKKINVNANANPKKM